jgi:hypothetical protein
LTLSHFLVLLRARRGVGFFSKITHHPLLSPYKTKRLLGSELRITT